MGAFSVEESAVIDAQPAAVYAVLADYRRHHPRILPPQYFTGLEVEQGGIGAGTVIRVGMRALGRAVAYRLTVSEPEPGRVLVEADRAAGVVTTFTVEPVDGGQRARVRIATAWAPKRGLRGLGERLLNPPVARRIYRQELRQLAAYLQRGPVEAAAGPAQPPPAAR